MDDVLASDVYGMEIYRRFLKLWMQQEKNLGYVTAVVDFNASSSATSIGQTIKYDIWYNETIINGEWYKNARYDDMEKFQTETNLIWIANTTQY